MCGEMRYNQSAQEVYVHRCQIMHNKLLLKYNHPRFGLVCAPTPGHVNAKMGQCRLDVNAISPSVPSNAVDILLTACSHLPHTITLAMQRHERFPVHPRRLPGETRGRPGFGIRVCYVNLHIFTPPWSLRTLSPCSST
jgi:hypothetical protein